MSYRDRVVLGKTGLAVSPLGLAGGYGVPAKGVEKAYHEFGINYMYWGSVRRGGMRTALRNLAPNHRDDLVVVLQSYDRFGPLLSTFFERGLRKLAIDYADVLLLGWMNGPPRKGVIEAALRLKEQGKVRFIALSSHHRPFFAEMARGEVDLPIDIFMVRYNAAHRGAENDVFPHLPEDGPGVTAYTATRWGQLLKPSKMPDGEAPMTASECYRFALSHPSVNLCMMGPKNEAELDQGLKAVDAEPLSEEELVRIRRIGDHVHG